MPDYAKRAAWFCAGVALALAAVISIPLPIPTSIITLMTIGAFCKSSPRFDRWVKAQPLYQQLDARVAALRARMKRAADKSSAADTFRD